jgi:hypothetical protein
MKEPMRKLMGIEDRTLKSLRMAGEYIPRTSRFPQQAAGY